MISSGIVVGLVLVLIILLIRSVVRGSKKTDLFVVEKNLEVRSPAFQADGFIPKKYSGRGEDVSPPLSWSKPDPRAQSIAVIMDDLDHPIGIFNHWVIWNLPATLTKLPEGIEHGVVVESLGGAIQGKSAYGGKHYYRGPKPPMGSHRYRFSVYVLDEKLALSDEAGKVELQTAMQGHVIQYGELTGVFGSK